MPYLRLLFILLCAGSLLTPLAAGPKGTVKKSEPPREPAASMHSGQTIAMKEKTLPPTGTHHIYIDAKTPRYVIEALGRKKLQAAFLFDQSQADWLRGIIPMLKEMSPLIFLRGGLDQMGALRLKETLEFFDYNVTLIHLKAKPEDTLGALPIANIAVLERRKEKDRIRFVMTRGKQPAETATLLTVLDERDLDEPFSVAGGIHFKAHGIRLVNLDEEGDTKLPPAERTVVFWHSEKKIQKFIEK